MKFSMKKNSRLPKKRKMQIINIAVNDDLVIIMNYKCDFALYKYLPKLRKFQKIWTYYQRHNNIERLDVSNYWNVNNGFAFCMNDLKKAKCHPYTTHST